MQRKMILAAVGLALVLLLTRFVSGISAGAAHTAIPARAALAKSARPAATLRALPTAILPPIPPKMPAAKMQPYSTGGGSATNISTLVQTPAAKSAPHGEEPPVAEAAAIADTPTAEAEPPGAAMTEAEAAVPVTRPNQGEPIPAPRAGEAASATINNISVEQIVVIPEAVEAHVREIYAHGQRLGRDARAFSKVGDSTMVWPPFMAAFDYDYNLGPYDYLQGAINRFAGSFSRNSLAAHKGMHSWEEMRPAAADKEHCRANEGPLQCEYRAHNPSVVFIRLGANDYAHPDRYEASLRQIVEYLLNRGVIPVLGTKPDRLDGPDNTFNKIVARLAEEYSIPLWDYDLIAGTVPAKGLLPDGTHFQDGGPHNYAAPGTFHHGDSLEDLSALMMLDAIQRAVLPTDYPNG